MESHALSLAVAETGPECLTSRSYFSNETSNSENILVHKIENPKSSRFEIHMFLVFHLLRIHLVLFPHPGNALGKEKKKPIHFFSMSPLVRTSQRESGPSLRSH